MPYLKAYVTIDLAFRLEEASLLRTIGRNHGCCCQYLLLLDLKSKKFGLFESSVNIFSPDRSDIIQCPQTKPTIEHFELQQSGQHIRFAVIQTTGEGTPSAPASFHENAISPKTRCTCWSYLTTCRGSVSDDDDSFAIQISSLIARHTHAHTEMRNAHSASAQNVAFIIRPQDICANAPGHTHTHRKRVVSGDLRVGFLNWIG